MIDTFSLALSHGLLLLAAWLLVSRPDLDDDQAAAPDPEQRKRARWAGIGTRGDQDRA